MWSQSIHVCSTGFWGRCHLASALGLILFMCGCELDEEGADLGTDAGAAISDEDVSLEDIGTNSLAVKDGKDTWERPEVVKLTVPYYGGVKVGDRGMCSGTLVGPNTVLTAAHCFDYCKHAGMYNAWGSDRVTVYDRSGNPSDYTYSIALCQGSQLGGDDLAWVRLNSSPNWVTPATIGTGYPKTPYTRTLVGFGHKRCGYLRSPYLYECEGAGTKRYRSWSYSGGGYRYGLKGDSGGPHFSGGILDNGPVVGVHSGLKDYWLWSEDIVADPVRYRDQIVSAANAFSNDRGVAYRGLVPSVGWTPTVLDGASVNEKDRGIQIQQLNIWTSRPGITLCAQVHLQDRGWQSERCSTVSSSSVAALDLGEYGKRLEAIKLRLGDYKPFGVNGIAYQVYVNGAWQDEKRDGAEAGTTGQSTPIHSIKIRYY